MMRRFWDAAVALDPAGGGGKDEALRFAPCHPGPLLSLFEEARLQRVKVAPIEVPSVFRDFDGYWTPFLAGGALAPVYCMSPDENRRAALWERLRLTLPVELDGSIRLSARAWAMQEIA